MLTVRAGKGELGADAHGHIRLRGARASSEGGRGVDLSAGRTVWNELPSCGFPARPCRRDGDRENHTLYCERHSIHAIDLFKCDMDGHDMEVVTVADRSCVMDGSAYCSSNTIARSMRVIT